MSFSVVKLSFARWSLGAVAAVLIFVAGSASAFQVSNLVHEIDPAQAPFTDFFILNTNQDLPLQVTIEIRRWKQNPDGSRILTHSDEVSVFPNLASVEPGARRKIRIGILAPVASDREVAYRITVRQLALTRQTLGEDEAGVQFARAFDMPLFVLPAKRDVEIEVRPVLRAGRLFVAINNRGNVNAKIEGLTLHPAGDVSSEPIAPAVGVFRILAGSELEFPVTEEGGTLPRVSAIEPRFKLRLRDSLEERTGEVLEIEH